jgi:hypothetical protein
MRRVPDNQSANYEPRNLFSSPFEAPKISREPIDTKAVIDSLAYPNGKVFSTGPTILVNVPGNAPIFVDESRIVSSDLTALARQRVEDAYNQIEPSI